MKAGLWIGVFLGLSAGALELPPVENGERLDSWKTGIAQADAAVDPLVVVCFGDSNTEGDTYTAALRDMLQGCYGERGYGYHTFGERSAAAEAPKMTKQGNWTACKVGPATPPTPWFAPDLLWTEGEDPRASIAVDFKLGPWGSSGDSLGREFDGRQRFRIHYQTGPGLGSFGIHLGTGEVARVETAAEKPGYGITTGFLSDGFRIDGLRGKVVLLGYDARRESFRDGKPVLTGGALVHGLGRSWGQAAHYSRIEPETFRQVLGALKPDLVTILLGTNDMHNEGQPDRFQNNLSTLIRKIREAAPGVGVLVIACPEAPQTKPGLAVRYRDIAREAARTNGCAFWSLTDLIGERSRDWTRQGFFADGLHYNRLGGALWARLLLRQLGFDLNDLSHYPALLPKPVPAGRAEVTLPRVAGAESLTNGEPFVIWRQDAKAAELRLGLAGDTLAVRARVFGANRDAGLDLYVSSDGSNAPVRQLVITRDGVSLHENGKDLPPPAVEGRVTPIESAGFEWIGRIPLEALGLSGGMNAFYWEAAAVTAAAPGLKPEFSRLFARRPDGGAFRDASQSAHVTVKEP